MDKRAAHLRRVEMPGQQQKKEQVLPEAKGGLATDFGFGKQVEQQQRKATDLDQAYDFWNRNQSQENMQALLQAADPVIGRALTQYAGGDRAMRGRAKRLAIDAFRTYDPKHKTQLKTHLMIRLKPLQREYTRRTSPLAVPERVQLDQLRLRNAEQELTELYGREPSDDEVAEYMGLSKKRIAHVRSYAKGVLSESQMRSSEGELQLPASEHVTQSDIWVEFVHHDLDPIDKKIMEWKTGYGGHDVLSTNEIAKRLRISPSAVSQRAAKIAKRLEAGD
jgi:DNA-directed RNA polymerase specialized sigma subunit